MRYKHEQVSSEPMHVQPVTVWPKTLHDKQQAFCDPVQHALHPLVPDIEHEDPAHSA